VARRDSPDRDAFGRPALEEDAAARWESAAAPARQRPAPGAAPPPTAVQTDATAALLFGIASLVFLPVLLSVPAIVFARRARRVSRTIPGRPGWGSATWGLWLGVFTLVWPLLIVLLVVAAVASDASTPARARAAANATAVAAARAVGAATTAGPVVATATAAATSSSTAVAATRAAGTAPSAAVTTTTTAPPAAVPSRPLQGRTIVLDPGHNGGNAGAASRINRPVSVGNGTKACDTTGTESVRGLAEHRYTWLVARHARAALRAQGARVVLTRPDDRGVGPCITRRMPTADRVGADLAVSIHADGGPSGGRGFHVILPGRVPRIAGHDRIVAPSARLGRAVRAAFRRGTGMPYATYLGRRGLDVRTDLGGLNLIRVPGVMIETGNMRNATDAALMSDPEWRRRAGRAIAAGVVDGLAVIGR